MTFRRRRAAALALVLPMLASGCAERRLVSAPSEAQGAGTWVAVWCTGIVSALVIGVLLTLPVWRERGGARFSTWWFTLQAGAVAVATVLLVGVAIRSWQLAERPIDAEPATALVRLSRADGDTAFFALMVLVIVVLGTALVSLFALGARFSRHTDTSERLVACTVLALQLGGAAYLAVRLVLGDRGWPFLGGALSVAPIVVALMSCWPVRRADDAPGSAAMAPLPAGGLRDFVG